MEKRIGRPISILYRKSQIFIGQALKLYDITSAEYPILLFLKQRNGITQEELASHLYLDKSAVTRILQTLELKGFVIKIKDEKDSRCNRVYLTEKGIDNQSGIAKALDDWNTVLMTDMEQEKCEEIYELLMHMVENVREEFLDKKWTEKDK